MLTYRYLLIDKKKHNTRVIKKALHGRAGLFFNGQSLRRLPRRSCAGKCQHIHAAAVENGQTRGRYIIRRSRLEQSQKLLFDLHGVRVAGNARTHQWPDGEGVADGRVVSAVGIAAAAAVDTAVVVEDGRYGQTGRHNLVHIHVCQRPVNPNQRRPGWRGRHAGRNNHRLVAGNSLPIPRSFQAIRIRSGLAQAVRERAAEGRAVNDA